MVKTENSEGFYHLHVKNIGRRFGRSVVAAAAYRAGETLWNEAEERDSVFGGRRDVVHAEIRAPKDAPAWVQNRTLLWNAVERAEKRKDSRLAKEVEFALPRQLNRDQWLAVVREMADGYVMQGFVVDLAIHEDGRGHNPHAHLLLTLRSLEPDGFGKKIRQADSRQFVLEARRRWEAIANAALGKAGAAIQIDARSYRARGIARHPGQHRGPDKSARKRNRDIAENLRSLSMSQPRDTDAIRSMLKDNAHTRYVQLHRRDDWPPIDREEPIDLSSSERVEFEAYWHEVDTRRSELGEPIRDADRTEKARRDSIPSRPPEKLERLEKEPLSRRAEEQLRDLERRLHKRMEADGREKGTDRDWVAWQESFDAFREQLAEIRELEEVNALYKLREEERAQRQERLDPVPDRDGDLVPAMKIVDIPKEREDPLAWARQPSHPTNSPSEAPTREALDWIPRRNRDEQERDQKPDRDRER